MTFRDRPIVAQIDLHAIYHNVSVAKRAAGSTQLCAVVKANAYGHGIFAVADFLAAKDASLSFATLEIEQAVQLRQQLFSKALHPQIILLEGVFTPDALNLAYEHDFVVVIHQYEQLAWLIDWAARAQTHSSTPNLKKLAVILKVNTGMNRLGFSPEACLCAAKQLAALSDRVEWRYRMTHFATADEPEGVDAQWQVWQAVCAQMDAEGLTVSETVANSAALLRGLTSLPEPIPRLGALVRAGIMLYGSSPFACTTAKTLGLRAAMVLSSRLIAIQTLAVGDSVGYGASFRADKAMRIGVVACGYADGYPRQAGTGTPIAVGGVLTRVVGRVSMDMLTVDLSELPDACIGSVVELWGDLVSIDAVAKAAGTIAYELMCAVAPRVPVCYLE